MSTLRIAWRSLGRNRKRTGLALAAIAIGQFCLLAMAGMMNGWKDEILDAITGPFIGDVQVHARGWRKERAIDLAVSDLEAKLARIRRTPGVESAFARIYAPALAAPREQAYMAVLVGLDPEAESRAGGALEGIPGSLGNGRVLVGRIAAERMKVKEGDEIAVIGQAADGSIANDIYKVAAVVMTQLDIVNRQGLVMSLEDAQALFVMEDQAHEIVVHSKKRVEPKVLKDAFAADPALEGCEAFTWRELAPEAVRMTEMLDYSTFFVLFFVFVAAVAGVANTMLMSTYERVHELGMLLALGARPGRVVRMILLEAVLLGLVGAAAGTILGYAFVGLTSYTGLDFAALGGETASHMSIRGMRMPLMVYPWLKPSDSLLGVAAIVATSMLAAAWPAVIAARLEPVEALHD